MKFLLQGVFIALLLTSKTAWSDPPPHRPFVSFVDIYYDDLKYEEQWKQKGTTIHTLNVSMSYVDQDDPSHQYSKSMRITVMPRHHRWMAIVPISVWSFVYAVQKFQSYAIGLLALGLSARLTDFALKEFFRRPYLAGYKDFWFLKYSMSLRMLLMDILMKRNQLVDGERGYAYNVNLSVDSKGNVVDATFDYTVESFDASNQVYYRNIEGVTTNRIQVDRPCWKMVQELAYYAIF